MRDEATSADADALLAAYRHDVHKLRRRAHSDREATFDGIPVNETVEAGADRDAARLSRPPGEQSSQLVAHERHIRLSLLTGRPAGDAGTYSTGNPEFVDAVRGLIEPEDPEAAHRAWLHSRLPTVFNESVHLPYTSLKYHTLLAAALLDLYYAGASFADVWLAVDGPDTVVPHRTVYTGDRFCLRLTDDADPRSATPIGPDPTRSWATVWHTLPTHPIETNGNRFGMVLDAQLRRLRSWSTALQYIEEYQAWRPDR